MRQFIEHAAASPPEAGFLRGGADRKAWNIHQENQRQTIRIAECDKVRRFFTGFRIQHPSHPHGLVGDKADRPSVETREARYNIRRIGRFNLKDTALIRNRFDDFTNIVRLRRLDGTMSNNSSLMRSTGHRFQR